MKTLFKNKIKQAKINWDKIPVGSKFNGFIDDVAISGRIQKENKEIFLCTNFSVANGDICDNTLGYQYSYSLGNGTVTEIESENVLIENIVEDPTFKIEEPIMIGDDKVVFNRGSIKVGCTTVKNSVVLEIAKKLKK